MISDFKEFALSGNLIDMATGIIIGVASGKLISSLVSDVIMPPIGVALGGVNFADLGMKLAETGGGEKGRYCTNNDHNSLCRVCDLKER